MRRLTRSGALLAALLATATATAHVGPSPDASNRYLKLSPLADGVRLVYTIYFGERPGRQLRPRLDRDRDGALDDAEAHAFGAELGAEVAAALAFHVDGAPRQPAWHTIDVGLGPPTTDAGSFAVDLVAWLCFERPGPRHEVILRDRFVLPSPGETELHVETSPGVRLHSAGLGATTARDHRLTWRGAGHPTANPGYRVVLDVDPATASAGGVCAAPSPTRRRWPAFAALALAVALGAIAAGYLAIRRRRAGR